MEARNNLKLINFASQPKSLPSIGEETERATGLVVRSVNSVDWDMVVTGELDLIGNDPSIFANKLLPAICASIASVDIASIFEVEEDAHMSCILAGCCKSGAVLEELNEVVKFDLLEIDFNHDTPPLIAPMAHPLIFVADKLIRVQIRGVNPWRRARTGPLL